MSNMIVNPNIWQWEENPWHYSKCKPRWAPSATLVKGQTQEDTPSNLSSTQALWHKGQCLTAIVKVNSMPQPQDAFYVSSALYLVLKRSYYHVPVHGSFITHEAWIHWEFKDCFSPEIQLLQSAHLHLLSKSHASWVSQTCDWAPIIIYRVRQWNLTVLKEVVHSQFSWKNDCYFFNKYITLYNLRIP